MIKILELFGGIRACSKALERLGIEYECVDYVEIDKYAVKSANAIYGTNYEPQDICEWDKDIKVDLIMHGSPCQDFSLAGLGKGGDKDSGTRSSLMYETVRIVEKLKPKYVVWENVKNLISKKHRHNFDTYLFILDKLGYNNYYQVLNAKNYGIPQNRERIFTISIRKDIDNGYEFPKPFELTKRLKDVLEKEVDEKYYLSTKAYDYILDTNDVALSSGRDINNRIVNPEIAKTISCRGAADQRADVTNFVIDNCDKELTVRETKLLIKQNTKKGYAEAEEGDGVYIDRPHQKRGVVQKGIIQTIKTNPNDVGVVIKEDLLKTKLCNNLIENKMVEEGDIIKHSYTQQILDGKKKCIEKNDGVMITLTTRGDCVGVCVKDKINVIGNYSPSGHESSRIVHPNGIAPTVKENHGTVTATIVKDKNLWTYTQKEMITNKGDVKRYRESNIVETFEKGQCADISFPNGYNKGKRVHNECPTINNTTTQSSFITKQNDLRIRKLTPLECWLLMGFDKTDYEKAAKVNSNAQLYKQAGNSIVVNVLEEIFKELFKERK